MGLDMFLNKAKRVDGITVKKLIEIENYFDYINRDNEYKDVKMSEWCGFEISDETVPFVKQYKDEYITSKTIMREVGYWRKANQIHNWFVNNVQAGQDDCGTYEVTKDQLEELVAVCNEVLESCKLENGTVANGQYLDSSCNEFVTVLEDGQYIVDSSVAERLLPTISGFFFGSENYDEYYLDAVKYTAELINELLNTTDFENEIIMYHSSW